MWFTKEERTGLIIIGVSMLIGTLLLNKKNEETIELLQASLDVRDSVSGHSHEAEGVISKVDLNTATLEELIAIPGIGHKTAESIIERRNRSLFKDVDELLEIKGIGEKKLQVLKQYLEVK
ncbi:MAG TPA: helix-hairpin-helix domain-containing protein [Candidatus Hydrothermia bacterium]|nr:helix-hairpin-helix domain-containing protein [Candidatus Hydrothermia bacterium]MDD5572357.1 helix-hairpin-helix domain-containing protein [Candidatus Hydrothermia bacterium]HOL24139.1 helix-hairpin-helix domain-containing protein [Candidatus Hydrothermia bacterium]HPO79039.1 helix-hairpin-helix domain-containing protein [Candidatus Hydrothermia bacterium]